MEERKLGVSFTSNNKPIVADWKEDVDYSYIVVWSERLWRNGNGWRKMEVFDADNNILDLEKNGWVLEHSVNALFNWTGTSIEANIIDPKGLGRKIIHDAYNFKIFRGIIYQKDVESIFNVFEKYYGCKDWEEFDDLTSTEEDSFSKPSFYEQLGPRGKALYRQTEDKFNN